MMTVYVPQGRPDLPGRPPCANCGAAARLHLSVAGGPLNCPEPYRPDTVELAQRELDAAEALGDEGRIFIARGNLQRLQGRP